MNDTVIKYTSDNGYTGVLYGELSLTILRPDGTESMHTCSRSINTYEELVKIVDEHPRLVEALLKINKADLEQESEDDI